MTPELKRRISLREAIKRAYRRRKTFGNAFAELYVTKRRRCVRLSVNSLRGDDRWAFIDLDDDEIDRLIDRLHSIRGGRLAAKRAGIREPLKKPRP